MNKESEDKLETIVLSVINRLYSKESSIGLDIEDLRCLEIIYKISKDARNTSSSSLSAPVRPENLIDLLRAVRGISDDPTTIK